LQMMSNWPPELYGLPKIHKKEPLEGPPSATLSPQLPAVHASHRHAQPICGVLSTMWKTPHHAFTPWILLYI